MQSIKHILLLRSLAFRNNSFTKTGEGIIWLPRPIHFSDCSNKRTGKGDGQDGPMEPCCYEPCTPPPSKTPETSLYDQRKYGHNLPMNNVNMYFPPLPHIPNGIFRNIDGEVLGLGAGKCCVYKNPEYFAYHHMSFFDMHLLMRCYRLPCPKTGRKP